MELPPISLEDRQELDADFAYYATWALKIRAKTGATIPLVLNEAQQYTHRLVEQQIKDTGRVRAMNLKGRQQGLSTYWEGRYYWKVSNRMGVRAYILTHEDEATKTIFEMVDRYHTHCDPRLKPQTGASSAKELYFGGLDSGYAVGTAGNKATGRSKTIQYFHGSEVAHWPNADAHKAGVIQTVPDLPGTEIALESTAFGVGGMFHDMWKAAERQENEYLPIFIPWFWQPEYRRPVPAGFKRTQDEKALAQAYKLDDMQLAWRRMKIGELKPSQGGNPEDLFKQEYPCNPDEAFLFSGRPVFDANKVLAALDECFSPKYRADIDSEGRIVKRDDGALRVWEDPKAGERYVIGSDVAEGLEHGDYSCADILRVSDGMLVAQWHGHIDPDKFGDTNYLLGKRYNKAMIGIERNNHGLTTLTTLRNRGYPNLYAQQDIERRSEGYETKKFGWLTTHKSKVKIIDQMAAELRDDELRVFDIETIKEMGGFVIHEDGSLGAKPGGFDDRVMARAIAGEMLLVR